MGISDIPGCRKYDVLCEVARTAARRAVYGEWAQSNLIQASGAISYSKPLLSIMLGTILPGPISL